MNRLSLEELEAMHEAHSRLSARSSNTGHGHVFARPDGSRARCGGPAMCSDCQHDLATKQAAFPELRQMWVLVDELLAWRRSGYALSVPGVILLWQDWPGGQQPCSSETKVFVRYRDGKKSKLPMHAGAISWTHGRLMRPSDIVAYAVAP